MSDLLQYWLASAEAKSAYNQHSYTGQLLENKKILERLAEIKSQDKPLADIVGGDCRGEEYKIMRDKLYAAAFYVVIGRLP